ncbi:hypothetical protein Syun_004192 [Stephania yunnanensis]|uniref:Uncharacterized protein n=1 Tax=Stephania yunnanensis TaxID=152371 RepID=A0AAP0L542_9MAGN
MVDDKIFFSFVYYYGLNEYVRMSLSSSKCFLDVRPEGLAMTLKRVTLPLS